MNTNWKIRSFPCLALVLGALLLTRFADASDGDFYPSYLPARVIAHLPLSGGAQQMFLQQEDRRRVGSGLAISETPENSAIERTSLGTGNAEGPRGSDTVFESVRVLDVSDPAHPRTVQNFDGVTSILQDSARNLVYVANGDGVWIVSHQRVLRRHECNSSDAISPMPNCD